jgi:hypothetical protein
MLGGSTTFWIILAQCAIVQAPRGAHENRNHSIHSGVLGAHPQGGLHQSWLGSSTELRCEVLRFTTHTPPGTSTCCPNSCWVKRVVQSEVNTPFWGPREMRV